MRSLRLKGMSKDSSGNQTSYDGISDIEKPQRLPSAVSNYHHTGEQNMINKPSKSGLKKIRFAWWKQLDRNIRFGIISAALLLFAGCSIGYFYFIKPNAEPSLQINKKPKAAVVVPTTVASPLTGIQVSPDLAKRPVTGVMIENSPDARPQSGLQDAGVVYEAIAEGGITRFLTLYQEARPKYIGPVRSVRPYYLDFLAPFDASIAHVGGSAQALKQVRNGMKDLDQFFNAGSYWRIDSRPAPHNVYTSFAKLDVLNKSKGYKTSNFTPWPRKDDKKADPATATTINLTMSGYYYNAQFRYDASSNAYFRYEAGQKHLYTTKENDPKPHQLHPKVVIALVMSYRIIDSTGHSGYGTTGSGRMYLFQDGQITVGSWLQA